MQAYSAAASQSEMHYHVQEQGLKHKLSATTEKIIQLNPSLLLGGSNLFNYEMESRSIVLTPPFKNLLELLVKLRALKDTALEASSLDALNSVLQLPQGDQGGLMRKEGLERWHLSDNPIEQEYRQTFDELFRQLGFVDPKTIDSDMAVDHCIIFGARTERMETRIIETLGYLKDNLKVNGSIFLLGSTRKLIPAEIGHLHSKLEKLEETQRNYWNEIFNDPEQSTEANAFIFLWECVVPEEMQTLLKDNLVSIKSTRIGKSYNGQQGHRATTEVTVEDWMAFYKADEPQAVFALTEQPYIRLADQLRMTVISNGKKADKEQLIVRIKNAAFYFASSKPSSEPLISVVLDEIARNVYRTVDTLKYLEGLESDL